MIETLRRIDRTWARWEGWLTVVVLILMVLVAGFAASVRNLTFFDIQWANRLLNDMDWADSLLRKGTLWLAFLGASLATYHKKHIILDPILRIAPPKARFGMQGLAGILAGVITLALTYSFSSAVYLNLTERPVEYELLGDKGSIHVCDATPQQLEQIQDLERPTGFCFARSVLSVLGIPAETPGAAFQLIVPVMLFVIAIRLFCQGVAYFKLLMADEDAIARAAEEERQSLVAQSLPPGQGPDDNK